MMLIFFALLVGAVVLVVWLLGTDASRSGPPSESTAQSSLRERFDKDEINEDE